MQEKYKLNICGLTRELQICRVNDNLSIAAFIIFGDVELTVKCAEALIKKLPEHDLIIVAEAKGIPLAYEIARQTGVNYIVARKAPKLYMTNPINVSVKSITTEKEQTLYIDQIEALRMKGKKILIIDDVISTGESVRAVEELIKISGGEVAGKAAILAEGEAADRKDIIYLEKLPLFCK